MEIDKSLRRGIGMLGDGEFSGTWRFQVVRCLGAGGMGVVYEAFDRESNVNVALKTLRTSSADSLVRFKREFRALADLQHPNLVSLGELIEESGVWFFTMELVPGLTFIEHVRPNGAPADRSDRRSDVSPSAETLRPTPAMKLFNAAASIAAPSPAPAFDETRLRDGLAQLARGLCALHSAGKVHRDIKPSNIQVTREGRVVLLDFGLVTEVENNPGWTDVLIVGTAAYMAPEQAASKPVGPEADWYSVGVVLYEALVGDLPFSGPALQVLMDKQRLEPPSPRSLVPDIPEDLDELCMSLLRFDPTARPSGSAVLRRLGPERHLAPEVSLFQTFTQTPPFVGRKAELASFRQAFADTRDRRAVTMYLHGESGVGKSALVRQFIEEVDDERTVILFGRCYEREAVPYKAVDAVIDALGRYLQKLPKEEAAALVPRKAALLPQVFPVLRKVSALMEAPRHDILDPHALRMLTFSALRELFGLLAERHPLIVVIDDLQWADSDSMALLGELVRPPEAPAFLLLATCRTTTDESGTRRLLSLPGEVRHLEMARLPNEEAEELASLLLSRAEGAARSHKSGTSAKAIAAEAGGHPLFIDELVRHTVLQGSGAPAPSAPGPTIVRLEEALWARIKGLDTPSRRFLEVVAVAGSPLEQETAARAAEVDLGEFGRCVSLLRVMNLVRTTGARRVDTVEAYHDRVRAAVLDHLQSAEREAQHRALARALQASGHADAEALAIHFRLAGDVENAAQYARQAAEQAFQALAFDRSARLYRLALELRPDHPDKPHLQSKLGDALANTGRCAEAANAYLAAVQGADANLRLECRRRAAEQLLTSGHVDRGLEELRAVLGEVGLSLPRTPRRALASLLWHRARLRIRGLGWRERDQSQIAPRELQRLQIHNAVALGLAFVDNIRGVQFHARGLLLALRTGEAFHVARSLGYEAVYRASEGISQRDRVANHLAEAGRIAERTGDPFLRAWILATGGAADYLAGRYPNAVEKTAQAEVILREQTAGTTWELNQTRTFRLFAIRQMGAYKELGERLDEYLRDAKRRGDRFAETTLSWAFNIVWLARDDPSGGRRELDQKAWSPPETGFLHLQHWYDLWARAELDLYEGKAVGMLLRRAEEIRSLRRSLLYRIVTVRTDFTWLCGRLALAEGEAAVESRARAARDARASAARLERERIPSATAWGRLLRAGAAATAGDTALAKTLLEETIALGVAEHLQLVVAAARRRLGELSGDASMVTAANEWMTSQRIRRPDRMMAVIAPGFAARPIR